MKPRDIISITLQLAYGIGAAFMVAGNTFAYYVVASLVTFGVLIWMLGLLQHKKVVLALALSYIQTGRYWSIPHGVALAFDCFVIGCCAATSSWWLLAGVLFAVAVEQSIRTKVDDTIAAMQAALAERDLS